MDENFELGEVKDDINENSNEEEVENVVENETETDVEEETTNISKTEVEDMHNEPEKNEHQNDPDSNRTQSDSFVNENEIERLNVKSENSEHHEIIEEELNTKIDNEDMEQNNAEETCLCESQIAQSENLEEHSAVGNSVELDNNNENNLSTAENNEDIIQLNEEQESTIEDKIVNTNNKGEQNDKITGTYIAEQEDETNENQIEAEESDLKKDNELTGKDSSLEIDINEKRTNLLCDQSGYQDKTERKGENGFQKPPTAGHETNISQFFTVHVQLDDGSIRNKIITIVRNKFKKPFLGGYRHKGTGVEFHNASVQTRPKPRLPPSVELFSRDTQTYQLRHQKVNTYNSTSTQMTGTGIYVSNITDKLIAPGKYETAEEYKERELKNVIIIQKYYRRWLAKRIVNERRRQRDKRLELERLDKDTKIKAKEDRLKKEYERRMHPKTKADFDLLYNGLEKWRQDQLVDIEKNDSTEAEKKAAKMLLLEEEIDLLAAIDRHKIDRDQESKGEEVQKLLNKAAMPKSWKDVKGRKIEMDTPYTIRCRELLDILNSLNMQYLTQDERLDVLLTLKHTVKEHNCKLTRDIVELVDREADLIIRNIKDQSLAGLRKRIVTLFLQYCKTPTFNPEISLLLKVPPDPSSLIGDINYCKYCGRYLRSTDFSLSAKLSKLTICKSCARKENQSRKRQDYSHYRRILKDLQMDEQQMEDGSKIAFIFKQNDVKTLIETVWDSKSILSECEELDELVFIRWNRDEHWSPWNNVLLTKEESEAHKNVENLSETYSKVMVNRINQKHVMAKIQFESLEKMTEKMTLNQFK